MPTVKVCGLGHFTLKPRYVQERGEGSNPSTANQDTTANKTAVDKTKKLDRIAISQTK